MSDMPSPPLPVSFENDEEVHSYGTLGQTPMTGKPKLLIRDQSFTGQYTFEDNVSTGRMKNLVKPYEEVVLPQEQDHKLQAKKGLTYAQMDLPQTNSCVHRTHPKTSYADVAVPLAFGDQQFLVANKEESMPRRSSSVSCSRNRPYENVGIGQRSLSVSKPRPVPPTRISSRKGTPKYENVGLNAQTKDLLRPQPAISRSVEEYEEDYEVMDRKKNQCLLASSDSEYLTMHPHRQGTQPSQRSQSPSPTTSPQQSPMKPQLNTSVKPPGKKQVSPYEVMVLGTDGTLSFSSNGNNVKCEIEPEVKFSTHTINPPGMSMPTNPLPIIDWLALFNLQQYSEAFVAAGYDDSSYLVEITDKDLIALGIEKPGHRKKLLHLSASTADALHDAFPSTKLTSISDWFKSLGLSVYEQAFLQQGYDDIDFIVDITEDELKEMGVTLQGHIRKLMAAIARLGQTADREEQLVVIPVPEEETRDVVSPLLSSESSARTSPQFPETRSQKVAPPKPRRPPRGWESSLLNRSRVEEEPTNCEQRVFVQPSGVGSHCHTVKEEIQKPEPPHRRDSFHRTREQMDKFRNDAVDCEQSEERSDLGNKFPPPPPRRDDSLSVAPSTSGSNEVPSPVIREPPPKPVRVDSIKEDKVEVVRIQRSPVPRTNVETPTAPKPAVKPRPPPIAKKPGSIKPSSRKPLPPTVAPKPALPTEEREPVSYQNAPRTQSPAPPERLSPGLLAGKPSPPTVAVKPSLPTVPMPVAAHQPTLAEVLADSQDSMPNDLEPPVRSPPLSSKPHGKRPPTLVEVLADSHDLMPNDLEGDLSLEEAIKTALRSPVVQKKHKSPERNTRKVRKTERLQVTQDDHVVA
ncbi:caskin-1-like isoform X2 [Corticium candelabrum]|uniref:caskin-1-like isoform X2 n=1 Tax=Corticium candelabrum TaxID=121492 RepID=UPI002E3779C9|nr:caskin-1-like isoform X2 [Corticium candelabrum]